MSFCSFYLILLSAVIPYETCNSLSHEWDYIIVGAGPAGLQMGYFLQKAGRDYVILERNNISGSFFTTYPRHDKLISINKRFTGRSNKEFNLRHDWNSLLSDDESLLFKHYSKDFFPHKDAAVKYFSDFSAKFKLNIKYNTEIQNIHSNSEDVKIMNDQNEQTYKCKTLLIATGMWKPNIPKIDGIEYTIGYDNISTNPDDFAGKSVLILGKGNTAFETASSIYGSASHVHLVSRSRVRLSWQTHYVGDLRGVNNEVLDTYQLKSLDGLLEGPLHHLKFRPVGNKIEVWLRDNLTWDNYALRENYDIVVRCLGWVFDDSIFKNTTHIRPKRGKIQKYPFITKDYSLKNKNGIYILGTAAHSLDFRKSSGGFIHGFRYIVRALHHLLEYKNHNIYWPHKSVGHLDLVSTIVKRVNEASCIYQMFGVLVDVIAINRSSDTSEYFEAYPIQLLDKFEKTTGYKLTECVLVVLEYGKNFSGPNKDVFYPGRSVGQAANAHKSNFLHPVLYYYKDITKKFPLVSSISSFTQAIKNYTSQDIPVPDRLHHIVEDFLGVWNTPHSHILPLRRFIEYCIGSDLRSMFNSRCFKLALTEKHLPLGCSNNYMNGLGLDNPSKLFL